MTVKHICFVLGGYPTKDDTTHAFVSPLVHQLTSMGVKCTVIAPQSITNRIIHKKKFRKTKWVDIGYNKTEVVIYQPIYISFGNIVINGKSPSRFFMRRVIFKVFNKLMNISDIDCIYGHFWNMAMEGAIISYSDKIPVFVANGEDHIFGMNVYSFKQLKRYFPNIYGSICASTRNCNESVGAHLITKDKCIVLPNAFEPQKFYPENKNEIRKKYGMNENSFIVIFVGSFDERKGVKRLEEALKMNPGVRSIFIGTGQLVPTCEGIEFCGTLPHDEIVHYLNCADVFVLPTLSEGCCNAIVEAMACGLPIISSNGAFNDDILFEDNSIRIDSNDIEALAESISYLRANRVKCNEMSLASLERSKNFTIKSRAEKILNFIEERIKRSE